MTTDTTSWSLLLAFNTIHYLVQVFFTLCMLGVLLWQPLGLIGFWGHFFGGMAHLAAIILTGVFRYGERGRACSLRAETLVYNSQGDSFSFE